MKAIRRFALGAIAGLICGGTWAQTTEPANLRTEGAVTTHTEAVMADPFEGGVTTGTLTVDSETTAADGGTTAAAETVEASAPQEPAPAVVSADATTTSAAAPVAQSTPATSETTATAEVSYPTEPLAPTPAAAASSDNTGTTQPTASAEWNPLTTPTVPESSATSVSLEEGLAYQVLREGTGREADTTSTRRIHYTLWLADGTYVESSRRNPFPRPFEFTPQSGQSIMGMELGTNGMKIGEVRKIFIPASLAYGENAQTNIPKNANLIFEVELVDVVKPNPAE